VAASNSNFLAAWMTNPPGSARFFPPGHVAVMPFSREGRAEAQTAIVLDDTYAPPGVGSNGNEYLVAWSVDGAITARRLAKNGTPLEDARALTPALGRSVGQAPAGGITRVVWNGAHYVVAATGNIWIQQSVLKGDLELAIVDSDVHRVVAGGELVADAATALGQTLVLSTNLRALRGRFIDDAGNVSAPIAITNEPVRSAAVASDGLSFLEAWNTDNGALRLARINLGGNVSAQS